MVSAPSDRGAPHKDIHQDDGSGQDIDDGQGQVFEFHKASINMGNRKRQNKSRDSRKWRIWWVVLVVKSDKTQLGHALCLVACGDDVIQDANIHQA